MTLAHKASFVSQESRLDSIIINLSPALRRQFKCDLWCTALDLLRTKTLSIFSGRDERLDHLGSDEVAVELIELRQPEIVAGVVTVWRVIRIAAQITKVLHQHEGAVEFGVV